jgi:hypothetical protein
MHLYQLHDVISSKYILDTRRKKHLKSSVGDRMRNILMRSKLQPILFHLQSDYSESHFSVSRYEKS